MQGNYDEQLGGSVSQIMPQDMGRESVGGGIAGGMNGGAAISNQNARGSTEGKDVHASHMSNNQHNELNIRFGNQLPGQGSHLLTIKEQVDLTKCKIHRNEDIKAFCKNDLCSICFKCLLGEHRNHDVVMLDEIQVEDLKDKAG